LPGPDPYSGDADNAMLGESATIRVDAVAAETDTVVAEVLAALAGLALTS